MEARDSGSGSACYRLGMCGRWAVAGSAAPLQLRGLRSSFPQSQACAAAAPFRIEGRERDTFKERAVRIEGRETGPGPVSASRVLDPFPR